MCRFDEVTTSIRVKVRVRDYGRAALGTVLHASELWDAVSELWPRHARHGAPRV
jgi:hypothetical protein